MYSAVATLLTDGPKPEPNAPSTDHAVKSTPVCASAISVYDAISSTIEHRARLRSKVGEWWRAFGGGAGEVVRAAEGERGEGVSERGSSGSAGSWIGGALDWNNLVITGREMISR